MPTPQEPLREPVVRTIGGVAYLDVHCRHCHGTGSTAAAPCCLQAAGIPPNPYLLNLREAQYEGVTQPAPTKCCACQGTGFLLVKAPA